MTDAMSIDPPRKRGRPPGSKNAQKAPHQTQARTPQRETQRGGNEIIGRSGEVLTRRRSAGIDPYHIPEGIAPDGWTYQWNTVSVYNDSGIVMDQQMGMYENGWRAVPATRHPGMFVPVGTKGDIVRGGQRLEERPAILTEQAKAEEIAVARRQMQDRDESLMGSKAGLRKAMENNQGFEMSNKYRGSGGQLKMSIDPGVDIPAPSHPLAGPGE
jgi:hypothetical protein